MRCWFAPHDIGGGCTIHEQIDDAIRLHDKLLRRYLKDETVDLIYLDPPFNRSSRAGVEDYNVLFAEKDGTQSSSQITAFEDTWAWNLDATARSGLADGFAPFL